MEVDIPQYYTEFCEESTSGRVVMQQPATIRRLKKAVYQGAK
jgi:hypothetical protein